MTYRIILYATLLCLASATGYTVYVALVAKEWEPVIAFTTAAGLEGLGFISIRLLASITEHNRALNATERGYKLPAWRAWFPVLSYGVIVSTLTVLLKIAPGAYVYSLLLFPIGCVLVGWVIMENSTLQQHATSKAEARKEAADKRKEARKNKITVAPAAASVAPAQILPVAAPVGHWLAARDCPHCSGVGAIMTLGVNRFTNKAQYSGHVGKCKNRPVPVKFENANQDRAQ